jgi:hypothetical protein
MASELRDESFFTVKNQTESLHPETAFAYSPPSLPGRPSPSLLERTLSEQAGVPNVV